MSRPSTDPWAWVRLGDLVTCKRRSVSPDGLEPSTPYVGLEHIGSGTGEWEWTPVGTIDLKSTKFAFNEGDVLYGKLRPNLRKCIVATVSGICSTDILPLTPNEPRDRWLIAMQLRSREFAERVGRVVGGASLPRVRVHDLLRLELPMPLGSDRHRAQLAAEVVIKARSELAALVSKVEELEEAIRANSWANGSHVESDDPELELAQPTLWRSHSI